MSPSASRVAKRSGSTQTLTRSHRRLPHPDSQVTEDHETVLSGPVEVPGKPGVFMRQKKVKPTRAKRSVVVVHEDLIGEAWWTEGRGKGALSD